MRSLLALSVGVLLAGPARAKPAARAAPPLYPPRVSTEPVTFMWPPEGLVLAADNEFVLGNVADPKAPLTINGATVAVHPGGGFLAWLPIAAGTFTFHAELRLASGTATADRRIVVPPAPAPLPAGAPAIDTESLAPKEALELRAGDWWTARMKATPGLPARLRVGGGPWRPMSEVNRRLGLYEASWQVAPGETFGPAPVEYRVGSGWSSARAVGKALVSATTATPAIATVRPGPAGFASVKTGPEDGFLVFPPAGTRMTATGRDGDRMRVALAPSLSGWIEARDVDLSTSIPPPRAETASVGVTETPAGAVVRIALSERVPFDVVESDALDRATIRVYSAVGHTNHVVYEGTHDFVDDVRWRQESDGVVVFDVRLRRGRKLWGWHARYDGGSSLRVELRRPPRVDPKRPLQGLRVMLDPGHMPSAPGAIGPRGTKEMDANYAIAEAAAALLERAGAVPLLTRATTTDEVSLADRPRQAVERGADLFVSLHNNGLPDGADPFASPRGFTVFYYHPHSLALGRAVHAAYAANALLPDEGLQWDNLYVVRLSATPSILVENAYMIFPDQEALLNDPAFRAQLAAKLVSGLKAFLLEAGERRAR